MNQLGCCAPHDTGFFKILFSLKKNDTDGDQWNVFVISSEDLERDEPTWVVIVEGW